jgi:hypothetical protein
MISYRWCYIVTKGIKGDKGSGVNDMIIIFGKYNLTVFSEINVMINFRLKNINILSQNRQFFRPKYCKNHKMEPRP